MRVNQCPHSLNIDMDWIKCDLEEGHTGDHYSTYKTIGAAEEEYPTVGRFYWK